MSKDAKEEKDELTGIHSSDLKLRYQTLLSKLAPIRRERDHLQK